MLCMSPLIVTPCYFLFPNKQKDKCKLPTHRMYKQVLLNIQKYGGISKIQQQITQSLSFVFNFFLIQAPQGHIRRVRSLEWTIFSSLLKILWNWRKVVLSQKVGLMKVSTALLLNLFLVASHFSLSTEMHQNTTILNCYCFGLRALMRSLQKSIL